MDPTCAFNFFTFFERILHKSNCIIFTLSWCATHTKIRSKLVVIVTARSQKITLWGPQRTPLGILRVNMKFWNHQRTSMPTSIIKEAREPPSTLYIFCWNGVFTHLENNSIAHMRYAKMIVYSVSWLRISGVLSSFPLYAVTAWPGTILSVYWMKWV